MDLTKKINALRARTVVGSVIFLWLICLGYTYLSTPEYTFIKLTPESTENQWKNLEALMVASRAHKVPLLLFDIDILPNIFVPRSKEWKNTLHQCKILCKHHPEEKNVITFAALASKFEAERDEYLKSLVYLGFTVHLSEVSDPRDKGKSNPRILPSYLWMARKSHVIHIAFLHERGDADKYMWVAPVTDIDWMETVRDIAPALGEGWHSLDAVGAKFPRYAQAYDLSHRFTGLPTYLDSHRVTVPYHIRAFLNEYKNSRFIECNHGRAERFQKTSGREVTKKEEQFQESAKKVLLVAKKVLDDLKVPFWITGGTLLGWYRQCEIIPFATTIEIGIWTHDYNEKIVSSMKRKGLFFRSQFGRLIDGMEMAFLNDNDTRINIYFFNNMEDSVTTLRTIQESAERYLVTYPQFVPCWSEFVGMKVGIPCDALSYIESYFGGDWETPDEKWMWYISAYNVDSLGEWESSELEEVLQVHTRPKKKSTEKKN